MTQQLEDAVTLQRKSYGLLRWMAERARQGTLSIRQVAHQGTVADAARDWLHSHATEIPAALRPETSDPAELTRYANIFVSYLLTSFDLVSEPGTQVVSRSSCYCSVCRYVEAASHLKAKKLTQADKIRAERLQRAYLTARATELGFDLTEAHFDALRGNPLLAESLALATYGEQLLQRCSGGMHEGATVLALWREFAWTRAGSPKKDFVLSAALIIEAQRALHQELTQLSAMP